jgi:capsular exopolysaccharide synthesis family protein
MGRIHDALRRAEEERQRLGGTAPRAIFANAEVDEPAERSRGRRSRGEEARSARRSRVMISDLDSVVTEEYRTLRARIQSIRRTRKLRSLVVTSARAGEGKTTTATNLALSFGLARESKTCLVDADLRTPSVQHALRELPLAGLAELLSSDAKLEQALAHVPDTSLFVLPVQALPTNPSELLASTRMSDLMIELANRFDTVIIDSPPVLGLPDATELVDLCDAALLVVAAQLTPRADVNAALERIPPDKVLGVVLNRCEVKTTPYGYGGSNS